MKSYSLWIDKKKQAKIHQKKLIYTKNNKTVLVKTIYSGISKGTEKLVLSKSVSKDQFELMKAPFQEGSFNLHTFSKIDKECDINSNESILIVPSKSVCSAAEPK